MQKSHTPTPIGSYSQSLVKKDASRVAKNHPILLPFASAGISLPDPILAPSPRVAVDLLGPTERTLLGPSFSCHSCLPSLSLLTTIERDRLCIVPDVDQAWENRL